MNKTNIELVKSIIAELRVGNVDEDSMQEKLEEMKEFVEAAEKEMEDLQEELEQKEAEFDNVHEGYTTVFLGLDTLHYRLDSGDLKIQLLLEDWANKVKAQNCAGVLMPSSL